MIPKNIQRHHVIEAIIKIDSRSIPKRRKSTSYSLIFKGKEYPPKYVISLAFKFASGRELACNDFSGGIETNNFLRKLGFDIVKLSKTRRKEIPSPIERIDRKERKLHDERCPECKETIRRLLEKIYGRVERNYRFDIGTIPEDFKHTPYYEQLLKIYQALQEYRGFKDFVKAKNLPHCDFFVPNPGFIVEFDESQHFSIPRKISLKNYPQGLKLGFSLKKWIGLCEKITAKDNGPAFRDEQRAWYDTLRDFLPLSLGTKPTIRLYAGNFKWCSLNPESEKDLNIFKWLLGNATASFVRLQQKSPDSLVRGVIEKETRRSITIALVFPEVWAPTEEEVKQARYSKIPEECEPQTPGKREFGERHIDLIVFPEDYIRYEDRERLNLLNRLAQQLNTHILVGARKSHDSRDADWRTLILIQPDGRWELLYHKHATAGAVAFELSDWNPQKYLPAFKIGQVCIGTTICHDSYLGLLQRYLAQKGAKIWINPSYDNVKDEKWNSILRLRAVENGFFSLCTLHNNLAPTKKGRKRFPTHPFGFSPDGRELKGYPPDKPEQVKPLSECTETGIYIIECPLEVHQAKEKPSILPPTQKQPYSGNRRGLCLEISLREGKPYLKSNGIWAPLEDKKSLSVGLVRILPGLIPGDKLFDISEFFKVLIEAHRQRCKPLFWNQWSQLPTRSYKLVDMMLGRTLEMFAPVILSDSHQIYEITEIAGGTKTMRRISVKEARGSVDVKFAKGLPNAFKMTYDRLDDVNEREGKFFGKFLKFYQSLIS